MYTAELGCTTILSRDIHKQTISSAVKKFFITVSPIFTPKYSVGNFVKLPL